MGLDGLSVANLGLFRPTTPAEMANQAEQSSQAQAEIVIKKVAKTETDEVATEEQKADEKSNYEGRDDEDKDQEDKEQEEMFLQEHLGIKKFKVKFNQSVDMVELIDRSSGLVIETITPADLINLISKSKNPSGILVDREI